jgi:hypothetical protein
VPMGATKAWTDEAEIAKRRIAKSLEVNGIVANYCELSLCLCCMADTIRYRTVIQDVETDQELYISTCVSTKQA